MGNTGRVDKNLTRKNCTFYKKIVFTINYPKDRINGVTQEKFKSKKTKKQKDSFSIKNRFHQNLS